jgi:gamma-glutamyl-gamma-aminobutyrate hydrolase PuuD
MSPRWERQIEVEWPPPYDLQMPTPRIGLTSYREPARWGVWSEPADLLPANYADAVRHAGGAPLLLPPGGSGAEAEAVVAGLAGLLLAGGSDVDPGRYGAERDEHTGPARSDRDGWELALIAAGRPAGIPILGVCRGLQVLNVSMGGTLVQHLPDVVGHEGHCPTVGVHGRHGVRLAAGRVATAMGPAATVATYHHQAIDRLADGLMAVGWADDGTIEAVEGAAAQPWLVGVQWHPEVDAAGRLFEEFVAACSHAAVRDRI